MVDDPVETDYVEPGPLNPTTPLEAEIAQRNAFMESLSIEAKDRFLAALTDAKERGMSDQAAWEEAVVAAETTYPPRVEEEIVEERVVGEDRIVSYDAEEL